MADSSPLYVSLIPSDQKNDLEMDDAFLEDGVIAPTAHKCVRGFSATCVLVCW